MWRFIRVVVREERSRVRYVELYFAPTGQAPQIAFRVKLRKQGCGV